MKHPMLTDRNYFFLHRISFRRVKHYGPGFKSFQNLLHWLQFLLALSQETPFYKCKSLSNFLNCVIKKRHVMIFDSI